MNLVRITDPLDPRIAPYRDIRDRDLVGRRDRFVAEGKVVLAVLARSSRFAAESALVLENRLAGAAELLATLPAGTPVYCAPAPVLDAIAGYHVHRGVLAIGRRREDQQSRDLLASLPADALVLLLAGISNHDNVGAIFRNAAAFEADAVLLDDRSCDPLYRKALRVSVGAVLKVPFCRGGDAADLAAALAAAGFDCLALSPRGGTDIAGLQRARRTAFVLGSEGDGLPTELMASMRTVRIGMSQDFDSLNVAAASAIALHRFWRESR